MYNIKYVSSNGKTIRFALGEAAVVTQIDGITEHETVISTSQGFGQIGESVNTRAVRGHDIDITGQILYNESKSKKEILETFPPMSNGVLWWEDKYKIDVYVKHSPLVQQSRFAKFTLTLYAPYPFWKDAKSKSTKTGLTTPLFTFPVNYGTTHIFGTTTSRTSANSYVEGNIPINFALTLTAKDEVVNPAIVNLQNQKYLKFIGTLSAKEQIKVYKESGRLHVERVANGVTSNAFYMLDDTSSLFELQPGDNPIRVSADEGIDYLGASIEYADAYTGVFHGM